ncbi:flagellar assembly protein FliH [Lachnospiraceae bacterium]|nr:flagellar assembly protein FliH [Lachnospiraceae bacterium]
MSNNLLKSRYVMVDSPERRIIDSNQQVADRIQDLAAALEEESVDADGFSLGLNAEKVELLTQDDEEGGEGDPDEMPTVIPAGAAETIAAVQADADEILRNANEEAERIISEAQAEASEIRAAAENEGREAGHSEGYAAGMAEVESMRLEVQEKEKQLENEFQKKIEELEPMFIDTLTDIYEHIFHVRFGDTKNVIFYLIQDAVRKVEGNASFIIHVSKEDYGFVSMQKKELLAGVSAADGAEIVEDMTLKPNECFIETGGGIFDCSLETQLAGLKRELRLLSYSRNDDTSGER